MALPVTLDFGAFVVKLGNGASPEVFAAPCAFTSRSLSLTKAVSETNVPDCSDDDATTWTLRRATYKSATVTGEGVLAMGNLDEWRAFFEGDDPVNCEVEFVESAANNGGYYRGPFHLTDLNVSGTKGELAMISVTLQSAGALTWTNAS